MSYLTVKLDTVFIFDDRARDFSEADSQKLYSIVLKMWNKTVNGNFTPNSSAPLVQLTLVPSEGQYADTCVAVPLSCGPYYQRAPVFLCKYGGWVVLLTFYANQLKYRAKVLLS